MPRKIPFELRPGAEEELFREQKVAGLVLEWQKSGNEDLFAEILEESYHFVGYLVADYLNKGGAGLFEDLCHDCVPKLRRVLKRYDPARGRVFSLLLTSLKHFLLYRHGMAKTVARYCTFLPPDMISDRGFAREPPRLSSADFEKILSGFRTRFTNPAELAIQKFIIEDFLAEGRYPTLARISAAFPELQWPLHDYAVLRTYVVIQLRLLFAEERPPVSRPLSAKEAEIAAVLGEETYRRVASIFAGLSFRMPGPEFFAMNEKVRRFLREGESERGFYLVYKMLRKGALEPLERMPLVFKANGNGEHYGKRQRQRAQEHELADRDPDSPKRGDELLRHTKE